MGECTEFCVDVVNIIGFVGSSYAVFNPKWLRLKVEEELCGRGGDDPTVLSVGDRARYDTSEMCNEEYIDSTFKMARDISIGDICLNLIVISLSIMLIVGICKRKPCLMLPFIIMLITLLVVSGVLIVIMLIALQLAGAGQYALFLCLYGIIFVLHLYIAMCVISHYQELRTALRNRGLGDVSCVQNIPSGDPANSYMIQPIISHNGLQPTTPEPPPYSKCVPMDTVVDDKKLLYNNM